MQTAALIAEESRLDVEIAIAASEAAELEAALQRHGAKQQKPPPQARHLTLLRTLLHIGIASAISPFLSHFSCRQASEARSSNVNLLIHVGDALLAGGYQREHHKGTCKGSRDCWLAVVGHYWDAVVKDPGPGSMLVKHTQGLDH